MEPTFTCLELCEVVITANCEDFLLTGIQISYQLGLNQVRLDTSFEGSFRPRKKYDSLGCLSLSVWECLSVRLVFSVHRVRGAAGIFYWLTWIICSLSQTVKVQSIDRASTY